MIKALGSNCSGEICMLVGKQDEKRLLRRLKHGREGKNKMDLGEIGWGGMNWIDLA
jgi:hypothetical protein